jgi:hypothetical protein
MSTPNPSSQLTDFHETLYEHYAPGGRRSAVRVTHNFTWSLPMPSYEMEATCTLRRVVVNVRKLQVLSSLFLTNERLVLDIGNLVCS